MQQHKLILIDGITGSGKSTTAHFLARQFALNQIPAVWFHEDQANHPLDYAAVDIEIMYTPEEALQFMEEYPKLWEQLVHQIQQDDRVYIIESYLLQDAVRPLFQNNLDEAIITDFFQTIVNTIKPLQPLLIYFYKEDAETAIRNLWQKRGEGWKKWFIEADEQTPYVKARGQHGETGALTLWKDLQDFNSQLVAHTELESLVIENSDGDWQDYHQRILEKVGLHEQRELELLSGQLRKYAGNYIIEQEHHYVKNCTIKYRDGSLWCDLFWGNIRLIPKSGQTFYLDAWPLEMEFQNEEDSIVGFTLAGNHMSNLLGKRFRKQ